MKKKRASLSLLNSETFLLLSELSRSFPKFKLEAEKLTHCFNGLERYEEEKHHKDSNKCLVLKYEFL